jgi:nucleotide-binding universal stress UspA family protein
MAEGDEMPGIVVAIDGSGHSQRALEWSMREAAIRHTPLTVLAVHEAVRGFYGGTAVYPGDEELTEKARQAAQEETDKVLAALGTERPESVTVVAVHGFPVEEIIRAGSDKDLIVIGQRGAGGFARLLMGSVSTQVVEHSPTPVTVIPPAPPS